MLNIVIASLIFFRNYHINVKLFCFENSKNHIFKCNGYRSNKKLLKIYIRHYILSSILLIIIISGIFIEIQKVKIVTKPENKPVNIAQSAVYFSKKIANTSTKKTISENNEVFNNNQIARLRTLLVPKLHKSQIPSVLQPPLSLANQRCNYNNQAYLPGDIVKTNQGWIRCTPTVFFVSGTSTRKMGNIAWTVVQ